MISAMNFIMMWSGEGMFSAPTMITSSSIVAVVINKIKKSARQIDIYPRGSLLVCFAKVEDRKCGLAPTALLNKL
jgi:hypothetical protein